MARYVSSKKVRESIGVSSYTLRKWAEQGIIPFIRNPGGRRLYDLSTFLESRTVKEVVIRKKICYCRVSSTKQKDDLDRQVEAMRKEFPTHTILTDVGSGINFKRKNFLQLLELSQSGLVEEIIVAYRDRLCPFAFELVEWLLHKNGVKLVVLHKNVESSESAELAEDLLSIITVFNCRLNGKRKYSKKSKDPETSE